MKSNSHSIHKTALKTMIRKELSSCQMRVVFERDGSFTDIDSKPFAIGNDVQQFQAMDEVIEEARKEGYTVKHLKLVDIKKY